MIDRSFVSTPNGGHIVQCEHDTWLSSEGCWSTCMILRIPYFVYTRLYTARLIHI